MTRRVLDNVEDSPGAGDVIADLLTSAPGVAVLVSTRQRLGVYGEQVYHVPPLALPDPAELLPGQAGVSVASAASPALAQHGTWHRGDDRGRGHRPLGRARHSGRRRHRSRRVALPEPGSAVTTIRSTGWYPVDGSDVDVVEFEGLGVRYLRDAALVAPTTLAVVLEARQEGRTDEGPAGHNIMTVDFG